MNAYLLSAIQSAAYGNQFECSTRDVHSSEIIFGSMRHENEAGVHDGGDGLKCTDNPVANVDGHCPA